MSDFGGKDFSEPLQRLIASLEGEAKLSWMGRILARQDIVVLLENRLRMTEWFGRHPEILDQPVRAPIFITGLPRTGSTILHELLNQDPGNRAPLCWQVRYVCPPPAESPQMDDPRIRRTERALGLWPKLVPIHATMHENGAQLPAECGDLTAHAFLGDRLQSLHQVPTYASWAATQDLRVMYAWHRKVLQLLQWKLPSAHWVLKAPTHMNWLDALLDTYPDARIVQMHRDPLQVMASVASLLLAILWMRADEVDPALVEAAFGGEPFAAQLDRAQRVRDRSDPSQFFDVRYRDLMADPFGTIHKLYDHFGLELSADVEGKMRAYLANKPRGKFGAHRYAFQDLGLDLATERARFASYQERYGVESEVGSGVS